MKNKLKDLLDWHFSAKLNLMKIMTLFLLVLSGFGYSSVYTFNAEDLPLSFDPDVYVTGNLIFDVPFDPRILSDYEILKIKAKVSPRADTDKKGFMRGAASAYIYRVDCQTEEFDARLSTAQLLLTETYDSGEVRQYPYLFEDYTIDHPVNFEEFKLEIEVTIDIANLTAEDWGCIVNFNMLTAGY